MPSSILMPQVTENHSSIGQAWNRFRVNCLYAFLIINEIQNVVASIIATCNLVTFKCCKQLFSTITRLAFLAKMMGKQRHLGFRIAVCKDEDIPVGGEEQIQFLQGPPRRIRGKSLLLEGL